MGKKRRLEPFHLSRHINLVAFRLALPTHFQIHDVLPYYESPILKRQSIEPPTTQLEDGEEYKLKDNLDSRKIHHWHTTSSLGRLSFIRGHLKPNFHLDNAT